jgi:hypothetical protein
LSFLGFGRRKDPGLERQRQAIKHVATVFQDLEHRMAGVADLRVSFAAVWQEPKAINEAQAKLPAMRELIRLLQLRADQATKELPKFDEPLTLLAHDIGYAGGLLENLVVTLTTRQAMVNSGLKPPSSA